MIHATVNASELDFRRENLAMAEGSSFPATFLPGAFIPTTEEMNGTIILNTLASASSINSVAQYLSNCENAGILHKAFDHVGYWRKDLFKAFMSNHLVNKLDLPHKKTGGAEVYVYRVIESTEIQIYLIHHHGPSMAIGVVMYSTRESTGNRNYLIDYHSFDNTQKAVCLAKGHEDALRLLNLGNDLGVPLDFNLDTKVLNFKTRNPYLEHSPTRSPLTVMKNVAVTFAESTGKLDSINVGNGFVFFEMADDTSVQLTKYVRRGHDGELGINIHITVVCNDDQHALSDSYLNSLEKDITAEMERALEFPLTPLAPLRKPLPWYRRIFRSKNA